jgi:hypothetical protein
MIGNSKGNIKNKNKRQLTTIPSTFSAKESLISINTGRMISLRTTPTQAIIY